MQVHFNPVSEYVDNSPSSAFAKEARRLQPEPDRGDALGALHRIEKWLFVGFTLAVLVAGACVWAVLT